MTDNIILLSHDEQQLRLGRVRELMRQAGLDAMLIADFANLYYLTGRVYSGYAYIGNRDGDQMYFVKRMENLRGDGVVNIRKPEQMAESILLDTPAVLGLELDLMSFNMAGRLGKIFTGAQIADCTGVMRTARAVKTEAELHLLRRSGILHEGVYRRIPRLYREGMTDIEFEIEIEKALRLDGNLGQFRISGDTMETHMGSLITGDNADVPSPYDFAMGGAGLDPSIPTGACGELIKPHCSVMVDLCGNFTGYMTDMSRTFALESLEKLAMDAHQCSIDIIDRLVTLGKPGVAAADLYNVAMEMATERQLHTYFMGHRQHAGFIGHGVGIEVNELPVIAPRSRDILQRHNVIALEPKFVIPHVGAVGIESTFIVQDDGLECITNAPVEILSLT